MAFSTLKMHDRHEGYRVKKGKFFDLPMRLLLIGKSQLAGKTNLVGNLILRPYDQTDVSGKDCYANNFPGRNIYIVCPSTDLDSKWQTIIRDKNIPFGNVYTKYDEDDMTALYDRLVADFHESVGAGREPEHTLLILDDCSFSGALKDKMFGILTKIACNGRHANISMIVTAQKYSAVQTTIRENATGCIFFECSNKQLDLIMEDHCNIPKKDFIRMFRDATKEKHTYMVINYSNDPDDRIMDCTFTPILYDY